MPNSSAPTFLQRPFSGKVLIFDLDDTLIDTSRGLIPQALEMAFQVLQPHVSFGLSEYLQLYEKHRKESPRKDFFTREYIPSHFSDSAREAFYNYQVPAHVPTLAGAIETLEALSTQFSLQLVTTGRPKRQKEKVVKSGLDRFFTHWHVVDGKSFQHKGEAFQQVIEDQNISTQEALCIGNRLDHEIAEAKKIGCQTCFIKYGEYEFLEPNNQWEKADHTIHQLSELKTLLQRESAL